MAGFKVLTCHVDLPELIRLVIGPGLFFWKQWCLERLPDLEQLLLDYRRGPGKSHDRQQLNQQNVSKVNDKHIGVHHCLLQVNGTLGSLNADVIMILGLWIIHRRGL
jgi:hypothetical protein